MNATFEAVTVSIGIANCESASDSVDSIVRRADEALYEAKRAGRNRVVFAARDAAGGTAVGSHRYLDNLLEKVRQESSRRRFNG